MRDDPPIPVILDDALQRLSTCLSLTPDSYIELAESYSPGLSRAVKDLVAIYREGNATPDRDGLIDHAYQVGLAAYAKAHECGRLPDDCVYECVKAAIAAMGDASTRKDEGLTGQQFALSPTSPARSEISVVDIRSVILDAAKSVPKGIEHPESARVDAITKAIRPYLRSQPSRPVSLEKVLHETMKQFRFVLAGDEPVFLSAKGKRLVAAVLDAAGVAYVN